MLNTDIDEDMRNNGFRPASVRSELSAQSNGQLTLELVAINTDISVLDDQVKGLVGKMTGMEGRMEGMEGDIKRMKGDIEAVKGDIKAVKGDIKEVMGQLGAMKADLATIINHLSGNANKDDQQMEDVSDDRAQQ